MNKIYCTICNVSIQKEKEKEFEYIGVVCSACFRMSKKRYCKLVDEISEIKMKFILDEINSFSKREQNNNTI